jgi:hypothetical protein
MQEIIFTFYVQSFQLDDDTIFSKIHKTDKNFFLAKTKKYVSYDIE